MRSKSTGRIRRLPITPRRRRIYDLRINMYLRINIMFSKKILNSLIFSTYMTEKKISFFIEHPFFEAIHLIEYIEEFLLKFL